MTIPFTITESHADRYRPCINFGGRAFWCAFDYTLTPHPMPDGIEIQISAAPDADTVRWFPDLKRGMESGALLLREQHARHLIGVRLTVTKILAHPIDTSARACERHGRSFIVDLGLHRATPSPT